MGAIAMLARGELRRQWKSVVALTLLVGFVGAVVLASVAGARRTATSLRRFEEYSREADVTVFGGDVTPAQLDALRATRNVVAVAELRQLALGGDDESYFPTAAAVDGRMGSIVDRSRLISGRRADPSAADEVVLDEPIAADLHLRIGSVLRLQSYSQRDIDDYLKRDQAPPGGLSGPSVALRVVGIERRPLDLSAQDSAGGIVVLTPGFLRRYHDEIGSFTGSILRVRTRHGAADTQAIVGAARRIFGDSPSFDVQSSTNATAGVQDAVDVLTVALWVFAAVAALAGVVAVGIVVQRQLALVVDDQYTLRALGLGRRARGAAAAAVLAPVAVGGVALAAVTAALASPLLPIGIARRAEPDPGFRFDTTVLVAGACALAALVVAIAVVGAQRATRLSDSGAGPRPSGARPSAVARTAAGLGFSSPSTVGLRMALEPGRGRTAVPVRSALAGAVFAVAGIVAVATFGSSLDRLVTTPRLYGWTWDVRIPDENAKRDGPGVCGGVRSAVTHDAALAAVAAVCVLTVEVDEQPGVAWGYTQLRGRIGPAIVEGRAPVRTDEVALGADALTALRKQVGDTVRARGPDGVFRYTVVGRTVLPKFDDPQPLAGGAVFTGAGLARLDNPRDGDGFWQLVARYAPGVDRARAARHLARVAGSPPLGPQLPVEVERLRQIDRLPTILAGFLAALGVFAIGHALVTSVRRRRRDFAVLKTLGFDRRQVRATVAWQATTLVTVGLAVGIPLGVVVGRLVWGRVADGLGISTTGALPAIALLLLLPAALFLANLIAALPARAAARARPAVVLRSE